MELSRVNLQYDDVKILICMCFQTNPGQSQMVLMNSEKFALLLAENLEIGSDRMVVSENISKSLYDFLLCSE